MTRSKPGLFEDVMDLTSKLPWWAGVVFALAAYFLLHGVAANEVTAVAQPGKMSAFVSQNLFKTLAFWGQYVLPAVFLLGAAMSAYGQFKRGALHQQAAAGPKLGALNKMTWRQFEILLSEAFRRRGYSVAMTGGGADRGFDLVMKKGSETFLVHCKQWRAIKLGVNTVREFDAVMAAQGASGGFVVTSGVFTEEAQAFAAGQHIELVDGQALHELINGVRVRGRKVPNPHSVVTTGAPFCPECQSRMVLRKAKRGKHAGKAFWGCLRYPDCTGRRRV